MTELCVGHWAAPRARGGGDKLLTLKQAQDAGRTLLEQPLRMARKRANNGLVIQASFAYNLLPFA